MAVRMLSGVEVQVTGELFGYSTFPSGHLAKVVCHYALAQDFIIKVDK